MVAKEAKWIKERLSQSTGLKQKPETAVVLQPQPKMEERDRPVSGEKDEAAMEPKRRRTTEKRPPPASITLAKLREYILRTPTLCDNQTIEQRLAERPLRMEGDSREMQDTMLTVDVN